MAQRKPYNKNTKYGRRKLSEDFYHRRHNGTPEEKEVAKSVENWAAIIFIIFTVVVGSVIYSVAGIEGVMKWLK